jgi:hypothetical protein
LKLLLIAIITLTTTLASAATLRPFNGQLFTQYGKPIAGAKILICVSKSSGQVCRNSDVMKKVLTTDRSGRYNSGSLRIGWKKYISIKFKVNGVKYDFGQNMGISAFASSALKIERHLRELSKSRQLYLIKRVLPTKINLSGKGYGNINIHGNSRIIVTNGSNSILYKNLSSSVNGSSVVFNSANSYTFNQLIDRPRNISYTLQVGTKSDYGRKGLNVNIKITNLLKKNDRDIKASFNDALSEMTLNRNVITVNYQD